MSCQYLLLEQLQAAAGAAAGSTAPAAAGAKPAAGPAPPAGAANLDIVPCDCLLLRGSAVVNEATLTGEAVPQMKDALSTGEVRDADGSPRRLDIEGADRVHVLFSGTTLISALSAESSHVSSGSER